MFLAKVIAQYVEKIITSKKYRGWKLMINIPGTDLVLNHSVIKEYKESKERKVWLSDLEEWSKRIEKDGEQDDEESGSDEFMSAPRRIV